MSVLVIDTSVWVAFFRGQTILELENALHEARVLLPPIVVAELLSGTRTTAETARLTDFLRDLKIHDTPMDHWVRVGELRRQLARKGIALSIPDAHVAQCALDTGGFLMSLDNVFYRISNILSLKLI